jgi:hypothetical protein
MKRFLSISEDFGKRIFFPGKHKRFFLFCHLLPYSSEPDVVAAKNIMHQAGIGYLEFC